MRPTFEDKFSEITFIDSEWDFAVDLYPCFYGVEWDTGSCNDNAILYLLAHLIIIIQQTQSKTGASVGIPSKEGYVQSESVGSVSVSHAVTAFSTQEEFKYGNLTSTSYGKLFLALINNMNRSGGIFV